MELVSNEAPQKLAEEFDRSQFSQQITQEIQETKLMDANRPPKTSREMGMKWLRYAFNS